MIYYIFVEHLKNIESSAYVNEKNDVLQKLLLFVCKCYCSNILILINTTGFETCFSFLDRVIDLSGVYIYCVIY